MFPCWHRIPACMWDQMLWDCMRNIVHVCAVSAYITLYTLRFIVTMQAQRSCPCSVVFPVRENWWSVEKNVVPCSIDSLHVSSCVCDMKLQLPGTTAPQAGVRQHQITTRILKTGSDTSVFTGMISTTMRGVCNWHGSHKAYNMELAFIVRRQE